MRPHDDLVVCCHMKDRVFGVSSRCVLNKIAVLPE
jgi:hypothetical protein